MLYSIHGWIDKKETFSFLRNGEQVTARMVMVSIGSPEAFLEHRDDKSDRALGDTGLMAFSHDGEEYIDELLVDGQTSSRYCLAAKAVSVRPQNDDESIVITVTFTD